MTQEPPFELEAHYNEYLALSQDTVDVSITVRMTGAMTRTAHRAEVIIVDRSGSMGRGRKMPAAIAAAQAAIDCLEDGVEFAVIAGHHEAEQVWPPQPGSLAVAADLERAAACRAVGRLLAYGGTAIGTWLDTARAALSSTSAGLRHAILLSDGKNESQTHEDLVTATRGCDGAFRCDCRGVGTDWDPNELRYICDTLHGQVRMVTRVDTLQSRQELVDDFQEMIVTSQAMVLPDVRLRVVTRDFADVVAFWRTVPSYVHLDGDETRTSVGERAVEHRLGDWGPDQEHHDHVQIRVREDRIGDLGDVSRFARLELVLADGTVLGTDNVDVTWTDDPVLTTEPDPAVRQQHLQRDLSETFRQGEEARERGDLAAATLKLAEVWQQAHLLRDEAKIGQLSRLVEVDEQNRVIGLRRDATRAEWMQASTDSTSFSWQPDWRPGQGRGDDEDRDRATGSTRTDPDPG